MLVHEKKKDKTKGCLELTFLEEGYGFNDDEVYNKKGK